MTRNLVSDPTRPDTDIVARWRKSKAPTFSAPDPYPTIEGSSPRAFAVPESDLAWMMLEIERLRAAIEGLVTMDGGRH